LNPPLLRMSTYLCPLLSCALSFILKRFKVNEGKVRDVQADIV